jgi:hypothetical protein
MASAHGAGLMVVPLVLDDSVGRPTAEPTVTVDTAVRGTPTHHHPAVLTTAGLGSAEHPGGLGATVVHTVGYLVVTGLVALLVFEKLGLAALRRLWVNLDVVWAGALIGTAVLTPFV